MRCPFSDLSRGQKWTSWTWWHPLSDQLIAVIIYCRWNFMTVSCHSSSLVLTDTMSYTKSHYVEIIPFDIVSQPTFWIIYNYVIWSGNWVTQAQDTAHRIVVTVVTWAPLRRGMCGKSDKKVAANLLSKILNCHQPLRKSVLIWYSLASSSQGCWRSIHRETGNHPSWASGNHSPRWPTHFVLWKYCCAWCCPYDHSLTMLRHSMIVHVLTQNQTCSL